MHSNRLQFIQNTPCQIITKTRRFFSVTGPLAALHWLPVKICIQIKICVVMYKLCQTAFQECAKPFNMPIKQERGIL